MPTRPRSPALLPRRRATDGCTFVGALGNIAGGRAPDWSATPMLQPMLRSTSRERLALKCPSAPAAQPTKKTTWALRARGSGARICASKRACAPARPPKARATRSHAWEAQPKQRRPSQRHSARQLQARLTGPTRTTRRPRFPARLARAKQTTSATTESYPKSNRAANQERRSNA